jgi:serine/threonine protein kinase
MASRPGPGTTKHMCFTNWDDVVCVGDENTPGTVPVNHITWDDEYAVWQPFFGLNGSITLTAPVGMSGPSFAGFAHDFLVVCEGCNADPGAPAASRVWAAYLGPATTGGFTPNAPTFRELPPLPEARQFAALVVLPSGNVVVIGGKDDGGNERFTYFSLQLDPLATQWQTGHIDAANTYTYLQSIAGPGASAACENDYRIIVTSVIPDCTFPLSYKVEYDSIDAESGLPAYGATITSITPRLEVSTTHIECVAGTWSGLLTHQIVPYRNVGVMAQSNLAGGDGNPVPMVGFFNSTNPASAAGAADLSLGNNVVSTRGALTVLRNGSAIIVAADVAMLVTEPSLFRARIVPPTEVSGSRHSLVVNVLDLPTHPGALVRLAPDGSCLTDVSGTVPVAPELNFVRFNPASHVTRGTICISYGTCAPGAGADAALDSLCDASSSQDYPTCTASNLGCCVVYGGSDLCSGAGAPQSAPPGHEPEAGLGFREWYPTAASMNLILAATGTLTPTPSPSRSHATPTASVGTPTSSASASPSRSVSGSMSRAATKTTALTRSNTLSRPMSRTTSMSHAHTHSHVRSRSATRTLPPTQSRPGSTSKTLSTSASASQTNSSSLGHTRTLTVTAVHTRTFTIPTPPPTTTTAAPNTTTAAPVTTTTAAPPTTTPHHNHTTHAPTTAPVTTVPPATTTTMAPTTSAPETTTVPNTPSPTSHHHHPNVTNTTNGATGSPSAGASALIYIVVGACVGGVALLVTAAAAIRYYRRRAVASEEGRHLLGGSESMSTVPRGGAVAAAAAGGAAGGAAAGRRAPGGGGGARPRGPPRGAAGIAPSQLPGEAVANYRVLEVLSWNAARESFVAVVARKRKTGATPQRPVNSAATAAESAAAGTERQILSVFCAQLQPDEEIAVVKWTRCYNAQQRRKALEEFNIMQVASMKTRGIVRPLEVTFHEDDPSDDPLMSCRHLVRRPPPGSPSASRRDQLRRSSGLTPITSTLSNPQHSPSRRQLPEPSEASTSDAAASATGGGINTSMRGVVVSQRVHFPSDLDRAQAPSNPTISTKHFERPSNLSIFYPFYAAGDLRYYVDEFWDQSVALPVEAVLVVAYQIGSTLSVLHDRLKPPIAHNDIKPANILLELQGADYALATQPALLLLNDFGSAKKISKSTLSQGQMTETYAAPERFDPSAKLTTGSDMWSLGVTLLHMMLGQPPHRVLGMGVHDDADLVAEGRQRRLFEEERRLVAERGYGEQLSELVFGTLAVDPSLRLTAAAVRNAAFEMLGSDKERAYSLPRPPTVLTPAIGSIENRHSLPRLSGRLGHPLPVGSPIELKTSRPPSALSLASPQAGPHTPREHHSVPRDPALASLATPPTRR